MEGGCCTMAGACVNCSDRELGGLLGDGNIILLPEDRKVATLAVRLSRPVGADEVRRVEQCLLGDA